MFDYKDENNEKFKKNKFYDSRQIFSILHLDASESYVHIL